MGAEETADGDGDATQLGFEDTVELATTKADAWEFVSDPVQLVDCVPGAEDVERRSQREYAFEIVQGIGPFTVTLDGDVELVELNEPDWILADGTAYDDSTGSTFDVVSAMEMNETDDGTVELAYRADLTMTGGVASVGARLASRVIRSNVETYFENVREKIDGQATE
ncbi:MULTISPECIES: CoxG family protein [Salinibaculum]|uniref:CoxG family protein n=1 Tax=Salinibaculum TaxID=2732368 RepID=UPI0030D4E3B6